jgi:hypothetical protein
MFSCVMLSSDLTVPKGQLNEREVPIYRYSLLHVHVNFQTDTFLFIIACVDNWRSTNENLQDINVEFIDIEVTILKRIFSLAMISSRRVFDHRLSFDI